MQFTGEERRQISRSASHGKGGYTSVWRKRDTEGYGKVVVLCTTSHTVPYLIADIEARRSDELCVEHEGRQLLPGHGAVEHPPGPQKQDSTQENRLIRYSRHEVRLRPKSKSEIQRERTRRR